MDSLSIIRDCIALDSKIAKLLSDLAGFVRHVREARSDLDAVSRELHSLQSVLNLLREDAALFPPELAEHGPAIIDHSSYVVDQLGEYVLTLDRLGLSKLEKRTQWLGTGRLETANFRSTLEAHRTTIGLALDLVQATITWDPTPDKELGGGFDSEAITDISRILIQMDQLRTRLPEEFEKSPSYFSLNEYMCYLKRYAEKVISRGESQYEVESESESESEVETRARWPQREPEPGPFLGGNQMFGAYIGDEPDSAIGLDAEPHWPAPAEQPMTDVGRELGPIDETLEPSIHIPSRPPTPPPKDAKRLQLLEMARQVAQSSLESKTDSMTNPDGAVAHTKFTERISIPSMTSIKERAIGRFLSLRRSLSHARSPTQSTNSSESTSERASSGARPMTPIPQASLMRRHSLRLSTSLQNLRLWRPERLEEADELVSKAVFGVSLQNSMQVAKGVSKTHYSSGEKPSRRDFPLCMQKCCFFLKNEGVAAPDIFAEPGDIFRVSKLKEIFSQGPAYGEDVNFANYTVYDAADLIMLYISQLPRPLIPESLAKRWIPLSRQATLSGSHATRLDQCIDFWEEALSGLRGPARSLFKLLLNLWADVVAAESDNDMTPERLAGVVLKPLMHMRSGQPRTDYMLSLAFLIRKRVEYMELLKDKKSATNRVDRAAW